MQKQSTPITEGPAVFDRLMEAYGSRTMQELADAMGEKLPTVKGWKQRASVPMDACVRACVDTKRSLDWLVRGLPQSAAKAIATVTPMGGLKAYVADDGPAPWRIEKAMTNTQPGGYAGKPANAGERSPALLKPREAGAVRPLLLSLPKGEPGGPSEDYELIPKHVRFALAGTGGAAAGPVVDQVDLVGEMAFSFEWMRRNLAHTTGALTSIQVRGDSMATTLLDGETIVIDEGVQTVDVDGIYVLDVYGRRLVKRVQHLVDGSLVLISDNPSYQRETIPRNLARDVQVIGRMVWPRVR